MKKIIISIALILVCMLSTPLVAKAMSVDGEVYDKSMWCAIVTGGFGNHNGVALNNDSGHTANLLGTSGNPIASYGYWYNSGI